MTRSNGKLEPFPTIPPERLLEVVVSNAPMAVHAIDRNGVIRLASGKLLARLGTTAEALIGRGVLEVYGEVPGMRETLSKALRGYDGMIKQRIGDVIVESWNAPLKDQKGNLVGIVGVSIDVTERELAEAELHRQYQELARLTKVLSGREIRAAELKKEIERLKEKLERRKNG